MCQKSVCLDRKNSSKRRKSNAITNKWRRGAKKKLSNWRTSNEVSDGEEEGYKNPWISWASSNLSSQKCAESIHGHLGATENMDSRTGPKMWNQDPRLAGGGNLYKTESQCPGPKTWNQDPRLAGGGNLYKTESQCPGPKMWNQDHGQRGTVSAMGK